MRHGMTQPNSRLRQSAGFSLIEVLVALVVLTIGIFAILRLFPGGFVTIARTAEVTQAQGIAQQQLDYQKQLPAVADSVVALDPTNPANILADIRPDTLADESAASAAGYVGRYKDPYYVSNVNHFLRVIGETFRISASSSNTASGKGAAYMLQRGPVYNVIGTDSLGNPTDSLVVRGTPLQRIEQDSTPSLNNPTATPLLVNEGQYAIDYKAAKIAFYPRAGSDSRKFVFEYEYLLQGNNGQIVVTRVSPDAADPAKTTITVPDVPAGQPLQPVWQNIFGAPNGITMPPSNGLTFPVTIRLNSEDVSRKFTLIDSDFSDADPYKYRWYSQQYPSNANAGVLVFNPVGYNVRVATANGTQPLTARVDYTIFDNHILREDHTIPFSPPYDIRLNLPFVRINGNVGDPSRIYDTLTTYNGMFRDAATATPDLLIYNTNTGDIVSAINGTGSQVGVMLDDRLGLLHLSAADVESHNLQGASIRVLYRTEKDWGVDVQKANARYFQADAPAAVQYNSYYVGGSDSAGDGSASRIYFPLCEAGKTVVLGEFYVKTNQPAPDDRKRFDNEAYQVNAESAGFEVVGGRLMTWIDVATQHPEAVAQAWTFDSERTGRAVSSIRGGSTRVRVVWRDAGRWRKVENSTFISQPSLR